MLINQMKYYQLAWKWAPAWILAASCVLFLIAHDWTAAYMAFAATWFATVWIRDRYYD